MRAARRLLAEQPEAGEVEESRRPGIRRLLLKHSRYHVYYTVDHSRRRVELLAIWHAQRLPPVLD